MPPSPLGRAARLARSALLAAPLFGLSAAVVAAEEAPAPRQADAPPAADPDRALLNEIKGRSELTANLQHLCDEIGPRLTGSAALERANRWAADRMTAYGLTNVRLEPWEVPVGWERGTAGLKLVEPLSRPLLAASAGWTPGTDGPVSGPVVILNIRTRADLAKYKGKLKGAVILRGQPADVKPITDLAYLSPAPPKDGKEGGKDGKEGGRARGGAGRGPNDKEAAPPKDKEAAKDAPPKPKDEAVPKEGTPPAVKAEAAGVPPKDAPAKDGPAPKDGPGGPVNIADLRAFRREVADFLKSEGVAAILLDAGKPHGLLVTTGGWREGDRGTAQEPLPTLYVAHEHYAMLHRLASRPSAPPTVEVSVTNRFVPGPITVFNTVGEVTGSEKPDEFVVVGAHLDSWDLASGATDNGTGTCVVLETARAVAALAKQGVRPKRTIRFALFSGEEQGLYGSKQYVKRHADEMPRTSAAMVHDTGTGLVTGLGMQGRQAVLAALEPELAGLKSLDGWKGLDIGGSGGTDHLSFEQAGVPGFACRQENDEYRLTHHTQSDTFDKAKVPNLVQGAQVMAVTAVRVANMPGLLPRDKPAAKK